MVGKVTILIEKTDKNINKHESDGDRDQYKYNNGSITITKECNILGSSSYFILVHKPRVNSYIDAVKYNGNSLQTTASLQSYGSVHVYYWAGDEDRESPLAIGLMTRYVSTYYEIICKDQNILFNELSSSNELEDALDRQNCKRNNAHVLNIRQKDGISYKCSACKNVEIRLKCSKGSGYVEVTHTLSHNAKIGTIVEGTHYAKGFDSGIFTETSMAVYFSEVIESETPLIISFRNEEKYYTCDKERGWKVAEGITSETLETDIPKQRCKRTKTHRIELSRQSGYHCSICNAQIEVEEQKNYAQYNVYKQCTHDKDFSVSSFVFEETIQAGITLPKGIEYLHVYFYPKESKSPVFVYIPYEDAYRYSTAVWYRKLYSDGNEWIIEERLPKYFDSSTVELLQKICEEIKPKHLSIPQSQNPKAPDMIPKVEQNGVSSLSSPSKYDSYGMLIGAVIGGLACLCLVGVAMWKVGPSVRTRLASIQPLL
ncbi:hypothetical protein BEWA_049370 [Theileria equi strain WA]|uniref:Uncharacterized protein n=1 Tax=Theileria equi strain WA TaxID=1537102 RepID=L1LB15_THEEQ|nr:hypothetical protein BEWA_049370 [Theileria equi strain WA]EKX72470.1 hypothetical protein BEWA_049370 [Theileria equi strain WA]|eukprot:XP_004831922.1 hypothetical protein BEWA_049370 [Theileria equi strain WA]